jgi:hypothetical protein
MLHAELINSFSGQVQFILRSCGILTLSFDMGVSRLEDQNLIGGLVTEMVPLLYGIVMNTMRFQYVLGMYLVDFYEILLIYRGVIA